MIIIKFHEYYKDWIEVYKKGIVKQVTIVKYMATHKHLVRLVPDLELADFNKKNISKADE